MSDLSSALTILSAMITPAVLISACASLILTTSQRLSRVIDRTRKLAGQFEELARAEQGQAAEQRPFLFDLLDRTARRSRLLQRALSCQYLALSTFVATSVAIGIVAVSGQHYAWLPIGLGLLGSGLLLYTSILLIRESRIALESVNAEMDFVLGQGQKHRRGAR